MTFNEALNRKNEIGETFRIDSSIEGKVIVVPKNENDLLQYILDYRTSKFDDFSAKLYSTDNQFTVYAIWTNGVDVVKKILA